MIDGKQDTAGYVGVFIATLVSAFGLISVDQWIPPEGSGAVVGVAVFRTIFALLPAAVAYWAASRRQKRAHKQLIAELTELKTKFDNLERLNRIEDELNTMGRLSKVAKAAGKGTATSLAELLSAIQLVPDGVSKERLVQRYRAHNDGLVATLAIVHEELEESGRAIATQLNADQELHILEREKKNAAQGIEFARELAEQRGLSEGFRQLAEASSQAKQLQAALAQLKDPDTPRLPAGASNEH